MAKGGCGPVSADRDTTRRATDQGRLRGPKAVPNPYSSVRRPSGRIVDTEQGPKKPVDVSAGPFFKK